MGRYLAALRPMSFFIGLMGDIRSRDYFFLITGHLRFKKLKPVAHFFAVGIFFIAAVGATKTAGLVTCGIAVVGDAANTPPVKTDVTSVAARNNLIMVLSFVLTLGRTISKQ